MIMAAAVVAVIMAKATVEVDVFDYAMAASNCGGKGKGDVNGCNKGSS